MRSIRNKISNFIRLKILYKLKYSNSNTLKSIVPELVTNSKGTLIEQNVVFQSWISLKEFGNYNFIGKNTYIESCKSIGSYCSISFDVKIGLKNHNLETVSTSPYFYKKSKGWVKNDNQPKSKSVKIGHDVLISANVIILDNVSIGTGSVIAAGAVVNKDVPPYSIVGGVPAKVLKYRFSDGIITQLLESEWWRIPSKELSKFESSFNSPHEFLSKIKEQC